MLDVTISLQNGCNNYHGRGRTYLAQPFPLLILDLTSKTFEPYAATSSGYYKLSLAPRAFI
jgi:hypothetical protein